MSKELKTFPEIVKEKLKQYEHVEKDFPTKITDGIIALAQALKGEAIKDLRNERVRHMSAVDYILVKNDIKEEDLKSES